MKITARLEDGTQIEQFEAMLAVGKQRHTQWREAKNGSVSFPHYDLSTRMGSKPGFIGAAEVFVRAPGYATASKPFSLGDAQTQVELELRQGRLVTVKFRCEAGREIPADLHPLLFPGAYRDTGKYRWQRTEDSEFRRPHDDNWFLLVNKGPGTYEMRVTDDTPRLFVNIDDYDFLRCFEAGPLDFTDSEEPEVNITLPEPGSVSARFHVPPELEAQEQSVASVHFSLLRTQGDSPAAYFVLREQLKNPRDEFVVDRLAPGPLVLMLETRSKSQVAYGEANPGQFRDSKTLELKPGAIEQVVYRYKPFSDRPFAGDRDMLVRVLDRNGQPVDGKTFKITYSDLHFGLFTVAEGILADGRIQLTDLSPTAGLEHPERFGLEVNERAVGRFAVGSAASESRAVTFRLAPDVGDPAVAVTVADLQTNEPAEVSFNGKVTLLEFWATWCGPCQESMQKLNQLAEEHGEEWRGRVQLVTISIDERPETVRRHLHANDWLSTRNVIDRPASTKVSGSASFDSMTATDYLVTGVPTALLIDQKGEIVFRGHPNSLDLGAEVERLLGK